MFQCPNKTDVDALRASIAMGDVVWHAGPMNMQYELMHPKLFDLSLNISVMLDAEFGIHRSTPVVSQRDVPGRSVCVYQSLSVCAFLPLSIGFSVCLPISLAFSFSLSLSLSVSLALSLSLFLCLCFHLSLSLSFSVQVRVRVLSLSQSIFTDFAVPVYLLQLIGVVIYFICLYIVYHV